MLDFYPLDTITGHIEVPWLWRPYLPAGAVTLLDGDAGVGKSALAAYLAARASCAKWEGDGDIQPRKVLVLAAEDDPVAVLKPRIAGHGGDLAQVALVHRFRALMGGSQPVALPEHLDCLRDLIEKYKVGLVVVDPLAAYLGKTHASDAGGVAHLLNRVATVAADHRCGFLCLRHRGKAGLARQAAYQGAGGAAVVAAARVCLLLLRGPGDTRYLATAKNNLAPPGPTLRFTMQPGGLLRLDGPVPESADELLARERQALLSRLGPDTREVARLLGDILPAARPVGEVWKELRGLGFGPYAIRAALAAAGLRAVREGCQWVYPPAPRDAAASTNDVYGGGAPAAADAAGQLVGQLIG